MVSKILFWSGFGLAVRMWQLGLEMRPLFNPRLLWIYPLYATVGGSFGYWLVGVEQRQLMVLQERKDRLLEKRRKRDGNIGSPLQVLEESQIATV